MFVDFVLMQGPVVNMPIPPGPSIAQVRSLKKGSSDQLAINIDSESDRLISKKDTTEDKGLFLQIVKFLIQSSFKRNALSFFILQVMCLSH